MAAEGHPSSDGCGSDSWRAVVTVVGITLGAAALAASGGAAAVPEATLEDLGLTTVVLARIATVAGFASAAGDVPGCVSGSAYSCFAGAMNILTAGVGYEVVSYGVPPSSLAYAWKLSAAALSLDLAGVGSK